MAHCEIETLEIQSVSATLPRGIDSLHLARRYSLFLPAPPPLLVLFNIFSIVSFFLFKLLFCPLVPALGLSCPLLFSDHPPGPAEPSANTLSHTNRPPAPIYSDFFSSFGASFSR